MFSQMAVPANRSGVVLNENGTRLFGMDAHHYLKMKSKDTPDWDKQVLAWLSALLGEKFESDDLWVVLKNGIVLIRAINVIKPGVVPKYNRARLVPLLEMDNIQLYLKACWQLGLPSQVPFFFFSFLLSDLSFSLKKFIFTSSDLHKRSDMRVWVSLSSLFSFPSSFFARPFRETLRPYRSLRPRFWARRVLFRLTAPRKLRRPKLLWWSQTRVKE